MIKKIYIIISTNLVHDTKIMLFYTKIQHSNNVFLALFSMHQPFNSPKYYM